MYAFEDLDGVHSALQLLMKREPPLVKVLPRQPGTKEVRYAHLLSGDVEVLEPKAVQETNPVESAADTERLTRLESEVASLQTEIANLKEQFASFRKQFE